MVNARSARRAQATAPPAFGGRAAGLLALALLAAVAAGVGLLQSVGG